MSFRPFWFAAALGVASMGCAEEAHTGGMWRPDFPMGPAASPSPPAPPQDLRFVSAHEAEQRGLTGERAVTAFGEGEDGNKLLDDFLAKARRHGAAYVSDVTLYFASSQEGQPTECRVRVQPARPVAVEVPGRTEEVPTMAPVTRTVTEQEYRCTSHMATVSRTVTEYQQRCRTVSHPVMHTETTFTSEYDAMSKTTRTVPHTTTVTRQESQNECRSEPVQRTVSNFEPRQDCRMEPVTRSVTRYEFQLQARFIPPRVEYLKAKKLEESAPVCYPVEAGATRGNRLEAQLYTPGGR